MESTFSSTACLRTQVMRSPISCFCFCCSVRGVRIGIHMLAAVPRKERGDNPPLFGEQSPDRERQPIALILVNPPYHTNQPSALLITPAQEYFRIRVGWDAAPNATSQPWLISALLITVKQPIQGIHLSNPLVVYRAFIIQRNQCLRTVIPYCAQRRQFAFQGSRVVHGFAHLIVSGPPAPLVMKSISPPTPCSTNTSPSLRISSRNTTFSNRRPV